MKELKKINNIKIISNNDYFKIFESMALKSRLQVAYGSQTMHWPLLKKSLKMLVMYKCIYTYICIMYITIYIHRTYTYKHFEI